MGIGTRVACVLVLFGSVSLARARSIELDDTSSLGWLSAPRSWSQVSSERSGDWSETLDPTRHPIRMSLDEPPLPPPPRPIRMTLVPPDPRTPPLPAPPSDTAAVQPLPPSLSDGDFFQTEPRTLSDPDFRQIRLTLAPGAIGAQGVRAPDAPRPFRLRLDESPLPVSPRPFRDVLE